MRKYAWIAALAGLLFGYDTGIISGAIFFIREAFALDVWMTEIVVSVVLLGAALGSLCSAKIANVLGRRAILEIDALLFTVATLVSALAPSLWLLIAGRIGVGFAIGIACYIVPLYISELAPAKYRGALVALNTIAVTGGIFISYLIGYMLDPSWRWMLGLGVLPAAVLWVGVKFLPESPRWLIKQGRISEAKALLGKEELEEIQASLRMPKSTWSELFQVRKVLWIGMGLAVVQQVTGINTILYYAPILFQSMGFDHVLLLTLAVGFINFIMTVFVLMWVDTVGRRSLLLWGLALMTGSHFLLAAGFMQVASLFLFVAAYASSIGCIFWIVIAEIYPLNVRGLAMGVASAVNWGTNLAVSMTFLSLLEAFGAEKTFFGYGMACLLSFVFTYFCLPETAQRSLEEIESKVYGS